MDFPDGTIRISKIYLLSSNKTYLLLELSMRIINGFSRRYNKNFKNLPFVVTVNVGVQESFYDVRKY